MGISPLQHGGGVVGDYFLGEGNAGLNVRVGDDVRQRNALDDRLAFTFRFCQGRFGLGRSTKLADWARVLVEHWKEWTHAFWVWAFGWLGIHLPEEWSPVLSFLLFGSCLTIGQVVQFRRTIKNQSLENEGKRRYGSIAFRFVYHQPLGSLGLFALIGILLIVFSWVDVYVVAGILGDTPGSTLLPYLIGVAFNLGILCLFADHKTQVVVAGFLMMTFWLIITLNQLIAMPYLGFAQFSAIATMSLLPLILLSVAPAKAVTRHLIFLALGLLLLIALNELSKFGFDLNATKPQGSSSGLLP